MSVHLKKRERVIKNGRGRETRPKTFKTKEAAQTYAKTNGIAKFELVNIKSADAKTAKYRIEQ
ncbi:MAG: hypothetical protein ACI8Y7_001143 [Candidatus Woesearchaeota archaeon]|jgi:hypothetical protein